ncbi:flippase [Patescibacteria group bacterium AH-259-L05]|nr:flippase [Patescibacteria group bacterium AH-259-L05]
MVSTAKNTAYLLIAYIYQKVIALFYFILLARYLGAENFGKYTFAISFVTLFSALIDFGLFPVLNREIARNKSRTKKYFSAVFGFNIVAGIFVLILVSVLINVLNYPSTTKALVYLSGLFILLDSLALCMYSVFRGHLNLKFESIGIVAHKTTMLIVGVILMALGAPLVLMVIPLIVGSISYVGNAALFLKKKLGLLPKPRFNIKVLKALLGLSWPFFIAVMFGKLYATIDTILLSYLTKDIYVGYYTAAQKLGFGFLLLVAGSMSTALYPAFSYYFVRSKSTLSQLFHKGIFYLLLIGIPLIFGITALARPIIVFIYGVEYVPAVSALMLFALAIPFMFLDYVMGVFLNAVEMQKINTMIHGIGAVIFIILNLVFIPVWFHTGAAAAVLISFALLIGMELYWVKKVVALDMNYFAKKFILIFTAALVMGGVLLIIKDMVHVLVATMIGALVYFGVSYIMGLINKDDIVFLKSLIRFKHSKL